MSYEIESAQLAHIARVLEVIAQKPSPFQHGHTESTPATQSDIEDLRKEIKELRRALAGRVIPVDER